MEDIAETKYVEEHALHFLSGNVVNNIYGNKFLIEELRKTFSSRNYIKLPSLLTKETLAIVSDEVGRLYQNFNRRDFVMGGYKTPRNMKVISGNEILRHSMILPLLYANHDLRDLISDLVGKRIFGVNHKYEFMVGNYQEKIGDSHGWHLDDPRYALIIVIDSPAANHGGELELIANWKQFCLERSFDYVEDTINGVELAKRVGILESHHHAPGDSYLLYASEALHRVAPIESKSQRRLILNMAYDDRKTIEFGDTANELYGVVAERD